MKKARFSEEQMVKDPPRGRPAARNRELAKKQGVSDHTTYGWRKRFGNWEPADVKRLRQLEHENRRLKKMAANRDLVIDGHRMEPILGQQRVADIIARVGDIENLSSVRERLPLLAHVVRA